MVNGIIRQLIKYLNKQNYMKRTFLLLCMLAVAKLGLAQNFTEGNLIIYRLGLADGSSPINSTTSAVPIFLEEYSISGAVPSLIQSVALPTITTAGNKRIVAVGNATVEGLMTLSADGRYLVIPGYDQALGGDASNKAAADVNRVVALVDYQKDINTTTALTNTNNSNSYRSATSYDGSAIWGSGGGGSNQGVWYAPLGATSGTNLGGSSFYQVKIFRGNLYGAAGDQVYQVGTGLPTTLGSSFSNRSGTSSGALRNSFTMLEVGTTGVVYVLRYGAGSFVIEKFSMNYPTNDGWTARGSFTGPASTYGTAIEARVVGNTVELYVVSSAANTSTSVAKLFKIVDTSAPTTTISATATELMSWPNTQNIRGIAWAPVATSILPIKLTSFKAKQIASAVELNWTTTSESNNAYFEVLKSVDGEFKAIGKVEGGGTTHQIQNYTFRDNSLNNSTVYYQLRQVDHDGKSELSSVIAVAPAVLKKNDVQVNASLSKQQVVINFSSEIAAEAQLSIRDTSGKLIISKSVNVQVGENTFKFPVNLSQSLYIALVSQSGKINTIKFIPSN